MRRNPGVTHRLWPVTRGSPYVVGRLNVGAVGQGGVEPPTSRLSGVRSNHLSYWPQKRGET